MNRIVSTAHAARPPGRSALARTLRCLPLGLGPNTSRSPSWPVAARVSGSSHIPTDATNNRFKGNNQNPTNRKGASVLKAKKQQRSQKKTPSQPALLRLDPDRPLIPSLTSTTSATGISPPLNLKRQEAKKLAQLHVAFQTGSADAVWSAYLDLQPNHRTRNTYSNSYDTAPHIALTPKEVRTVFNIVSNDAARTKRGVNRILRLMSDIRGQQRRLLTQLQHAHDANNSPRGRLLTSELEAWDKVVSPELLNWTVAHIGRSLRSVGLEEIDQVLDQLLTYEANEQSRRSAATDDSMANKPARPLSTASALDDLRTAILSPVVRSVLSKKRGNHRQPDFPDISIYNTILDIITRTIRRSSNVRRTASSEPQAYDEDEEDAMSKFTEQQRESHSAELNASIATKLRRFDLDADAAPVHADAFERADRLFHSVLERMQRKSGIEPDAITFNIMITMYCLLDRWEMVHRVVRSANDQGALTIDCINNVLWHWLVRGPASTTPLGGKQDHEASAMDSALEVYRQLRQNWLYAELASQHSSIAYGKRDMRTHGAHDQNQDGAATSQDDLGPLAWPDRDGLPSDCSRLDSTMATKSDAVQTVLGISSFPPKVIPDEITHALIINSLTREGRFADALSVFRDLVSTPARLSSNERKSDEIGVKPKLLEAEEERKMQPTLAIFDSFFRGFSRHGRPSTAIAFDPRDPGNTTWELVTNPESSQAEEKVATQQQQDDPRVRQLQMWRIEAFEEIFDAFLNFEPDVSKVLGSRAGTTHGGREAKRERGDDRVSTPYGWLTLNEKRRLDALRRAPSTNQLFWVLTAIRRVSHDHAEWSLAMWQKVVDKFGPQPATSSNKLVWIEFNLDNRLRRVLDHLEARLTQEQDADEPSSTGQ